jgi:mono/diheme cytochrome c family protein
MSTKSEQPETPPVVGMLAEYAAPGTLKAAAAGLREAGYARYEAYSPFPVHGLYEAMRRKRTLLPRLVLAGGFAGCLGALLLQWWTNAIDYPYQISGKPPFSLPANIPIAFELLILLGALAAFLGVMVLSNLPWWSDPIFCCEKFRKATTDGFFLAVDAADPRYDAAATAELLCRLGAESVETYLAEPKQRIPGIITGGIVLLLALALLPPLWIAQVRFERKTKPRLHLILDMDFQPKYLPQQFSPLFADTRDMRPPVSGTFPVDAPLGKEHLLLGLVGGKPAETFPMPITAAMMQRGRARFNIFCAACHGYAGYGDGPTALLATQREEPKWVPPLSLHNQPIIDQPVGQIFQTIGNGIRTMPSYGVQIPPEDRWAIILYVRALEKSRNAAIEDVPKELRKNLQVSKTTKPRNDKKTDNRH